MATPSLPDRPPCRSRRHRGQATPNPTVAGLAICVGCRDQLEDDFIELPGWYDLCAHVLDLCRPQLDERVTGSRRRGIVLRDAMVTVRSDILGALASWCGLVVGERGVAGPDELCVRKLTTFMAIHVNWLAAHPAAADLVDELTALIESVQVVVRPRDWLLPRGRTAERPGEIWASRDGE